jgi:hypothetical protein
MAAARWSQADKITADNNVDRKDERCHLKHCHLAITHNPSCKQVDSLRCHTMNRVRAYCHTMKE